MMHRAQHVGDWKSTVGQLEMISYITPQLSVGISTTLRISFPDILGISAPASPMAASNI